MRYHHRSKTPPGRYWKVQCQCGEEAVKSCQRNVQLHMRAHARHCKDAAFTVTEIVIGQKQETATP